MKHANNILVHQKIIKLTDFGLSKKISEASDGMSKIRGVLPYMDTKGIDDKNYKLTYNFWAIGANQDPAKAKGAAETYAIKYILTKFFLIPIRDIDDPDYNKNDFNSSFENSEKREKGSVEEFLKEYNLKK